MLPQTASSDPASVVPYWRADEIADKLIGILAAMPSMVAAGYSAADLAGLLRRIEESAATARRALLEDLTPTDPDDVWPAGVAYESYDGGSLDRTYDDEGILDLIGGDPVSGLIAARDAALFRIGWSWTALDRYVRAKGLPLIVRRPGRKEQDEGDRRTPHVVETWKGRPSVRPIP